LLQPSIAILPPFVFAWRHKTIGGIFFIVGSIERQGKRRIRATVGLC